MKTKRILDKLGPGFIYLVSGIDLYKDVAPLLSGTPATLWDLVLIILGIGGVGVASLWVGLKWSVWRGKQASLFARKEPGQPTQQAQQHLFLFTRKEIEPDFEKFLQEAINEVVIIGASLHLSITGKEDIFLRLVEQKRLNLKFLILDPESKLIARLDHDLDWGLSGQMKTTMESFERLKNELSPDLKEKLQMGFFDRVPIISMIVLDPESPKPTIQIVNYASGTDIGSRFAIQIRGLDRMDVIVGKYLREYQKFLKSSKPYEKKKEINPLAGKWGD